MGNLKVIIKNIGIFIVGITLGGIINMSLIITGGLVFPFYENFNPMNAINWDFKYFIFPFLAHALGTLSGSFIASKLSNNKSNIIPLIIGIYFLAGGIYMMTILPAPTWFIILDLSLCYIPMAFLGWKISQ